MLKVGIDCVEEVFHYRDSVKLAKPLCRQDGERGG